MESPIEIKEPGDESSPDQAALPFDDPSPVPAAQSNHTPRCESCGGPAEAGDICAVCQRAFHTMLDNPKDNEKAETSDHAAELDALFKALEAAPREAAGPPVVTAPPAQPEVLAPPVAEVEPVPSPATDAAGPELATVAAAPETPSSPSSPAAAPAAPLPAAPAVPAAPAPSLEAVAVAKPTAPEAAALRASRVGQFRSLAAAAAVVIIVGAIGVPLTRLWLGRRQQIITVAQPARPAESLAGSVPKRNAAGTTATAAATRKIETAVAAPAAAPVTNVTAAGMNKPTPRVQPRTLRPSSMTAPQPAIATPSFVSEAPVETALPAPEAVVPAAPLDPEPTAAPLGPFFEIRSVDQPPQVVSRVEPQVPVSLQGRALNEIVVVRILVSQAGQPTLVSLLRRSKSGPELDGAVVAAVKQWRFTPAAKRGEAVSCFFHVGVAVGRTE